MLPGGKEILEGAINDQMATRAWPLPGKVAVGDLEAVLRGRSDTSWHLSPPVFPLTRDGSIDPGAGLEHGSPAPPRPCAAASRPPPRPPALRRPPPASMCRSPGGILASPRLGRDGGGGCGRGRGCGSGSAIGGGA